MLIDFHIFSNDNESCILIRQEKITEFNIWCFKKN